MIDTITASLERRLHTTPHDMMVSEALIAIRALITERDGARALCAEYGAALGMCERRVEELTKAIERLRFGDVTAEEEEADRVAVKRFQDHLRRQLREAEERGRVATRIEWRGYLRKAIMRVRTVRSENARLRAVVTAAHAFRATWFGNPALFPDGPLAIGAAWTDLDDALAALGGTEDGR